MVSDDACNSPRVFHFDDFVRDGGRGGFALNGLGDDLQKNERTRIIDMPRPLHALW